MQNIDEIADFMDELRENFPNNWQEIFDNFVKMAGSIELLPYYLDSIKEKIRRT